MKKLHIISIVVLGLLLAPAITFACEKHSPKKEISKSSTKQCCSKDKVSCEADEGCGGKCGHKQCGCSATTSVAIAIVSPIYFPISVSCIISGKKTFFLNESAISSGFFSLWLIPKIC